MRLVWTSRYCNLSFCKTAALKSIKFLINGVSLFYFRWLLFWTIFCFASLIGRLIGGECEKVLLLLFLFDFQTQILRNYRFILLTRSQSKFLSNVGFLCKKDLLYFRSIFFVPHETEISQWGCASCFTCSESIAIVLNTWVEKISEKSSPEKAWIINISIW